MAVSPALASTLYTLAIVAAAAMKDSAAIAAGSPERARSPQVEAAVEAAVAAAAAAVAAAAVAAAAVAAAKGCCRNCGKKHSPFRGCLREVSVSSLPVRGVGEDALLAAPKPLAPKPQQQSRSQVWWMQEDEWVAAAPGPAAAAQGEHGQVHAVCSNGSTQPSLKSSLEQLADADTDFDTDADTSVRALPLALFLNL